MHLNLFHVWRLVGWLNGTLSGITRLHDCWLLIYLLFPRPVESLLTLWLYEWWKYEPASPRSHKLQRYFSDKIFAFPFFAAVCKRFCCVIFSDGFSFMDCQTLKREPAMLRSCHVTEKIFWATHIFMKINFRTMFSNAREQIWLRLISSAATVSPLNYYTHIFLPLPQMSHRLCSKNFMYIFRWKKTSFMMIYGIACDVAQIFLLFLLFYDVFLLLVVTEFL